MKLIVTAYVVIIVMSITLTSLKTGSATSLKSLPLVKVLVEYKHKGKLLIPRNSP